MPLDHKGLGILFYFLVILIAKRAKVSISTVSLPFNSPERVSEATRVRIYQATKELKY
ncbi:helix-turn-helix domain-containing protein [Blautia hominis]|uniref:helix-turn-helix domain-containing protein n=1 Tax=Blautia hominis TaxID=2025493 RepID=UPI0036F1F736